MPLSGWTPYDEHKGTVFRTAYAILGDRHAAEDVTHDVFLRLWAEPERYDAGRAELGTYLKMVTRTSAIDTWRRGASGRRAQERLEALAMVSDALAADPATLVERDTVARDVRRAVQALPPAQRETIGLSYWGGLSASEIAARCDTPLGTVKSRARLGLSRLRDETERAVA